MNQIDGEKKKTQLTHWAFMSYFASLQIKLYHDQTAPQELSDQGILYLPICDTRINIFLRTIKKYAIWLTCCGILSNNFSWGIRILIKLSGDDVWSYLRIRLFLKKWCQMLTIWCKFDIQYFYFDRVKI